jgi:amidase
LKHLLSHALLAAACAHAADFNPLDATIPQIQTAVRRHQLTYEHLVRLYLRRIEAYDRSGPKLNSIRHLNPKAVEIAKERRPARAAVRYPGAAQGQHRHGR